MCRPDSLEGQGLTAVTQGLSTAFNATALALSLTMVLMFLSFLVERLEQGVLEQVDRYVDMQLTHRFERNGAESGKFVEALRQNTQVLVKTMEQLVRTPGRRLGQEHGKGRPPLQRHRQAAAGDDERRRWSTPWKPR